MPNYIRRHLENIDVEILIPAGSMDPPTQSAETDMRAVLNPKNWKLPTDNFVTDCLSTADDVAYAMNWHLGGCERSTRDEGGRILHVVRSKGYYHYIGS